MLKNLNWRFLIYSSFMSVCFWASTSLFVACSSYDKQVIKEELEYCVDLDGEAMRDCLVKQAQLLTDRIILKAQEQGTSIKAALNDPKLLEIEKAIDELSEKLD